MNSSLKTLCLKVNVIQNVAVIAIMQALMKNTALTSLNLIHNNFGVDDANEIAKLLIDNIHIKKLYIAVNEYMGTGVIEIARSLSINSSLQILILCFSNINENENTRLRYLSFKGNYIRDSE